MEISSIKRLYYFRITIVYLRLIAYRFYRDLCRCFVLFSYLCGSNRINNFVKFGK
jgi:hypothetical protein